MPEVSIIVPSYNRPDKLRVCLDALQHLEGGPYEIIVVDDGSETPLEPIAAAFGPNVRALRQENAGPAAARNAGARASIGDFLAFTDDDCAPRPGWACALAAAQGGRDDVLVGGRVENALTENVYSAASQTLSDFLYRYHGAERGDAPFFTSNNLGCGRARFLAIGGFDEDFPLAAGEDRDFGMRWRAAGGDLSYVGDAIVDHSHRLSLCGFWRQHRNYGRGARRLHTVLSDRAAPGRKFGSAHFYFSLLVSPFAGPGHRRLTQAALMILSQCAMIDGYLRGIFADALQRRHIGETR